MEDRLEFYNKEFCRLTKALEIPCVMLQAAQVDELINKRIPIWMLMRMPLDNSGVYVYKHGCADIYAMVYFDTRSMQETIVVFRQAQGNLWDFMFYDSCSEYSGGIFTDGISEAVFDFAIRGAFPFFSPDGRKDGFTYQFTAEKVGRCIELWLEIAYDGKMIHRCKVRRGGKFCSKQQWRKFLSEVEHLVAYFTL